MFEIYTVFISLSLFQIITGLQHVQVVSLMFKKSSSKKERNNSITVHTIPLDQTYIRSDGRKRLPWLGRHVGKFLRKQSSRVKKKPSFFRRFKNRTVDVTQSFSIPSNSSSPKNILLPQKVRVNERSNEPAMEKRWSHTQTETDACISTGTFHVTGSSIQCDDTKQQSTWLYTKPEFYDSTQFPTYHPQGTTQHVC